MSVHRARTACPNCNTEEEVWYYKSTISPIEVVQCVKCDLVYEAGDYIQNLIELYQNVTVSATEVVAEINI
jgi:Zn ribbon nucleic-acid-binding protein